MGLVGIFAKISGIRKSLGKMSIMYINDGNGWRTMITTESVDGT